MHGQIAVFSVCLFMRQKISRFKKVKNFENNSKLKSLPALNNRAVMSTRPNRPKRGYIRLTNVEKLCKARGKANVVTINKHKR